MTLSIVTAFGLEALNEHYGDLIMADLSFFEAPIIYIHCLMHSQNSCLN